MGRSEVNGLNGRESHIVSCHWTPAGSKCKCREAQDKLVMNINKLKRQTTTWQHDDSTDPYSPHTAIGTGWFYFARFAHSRRYLQIRFARSRCYHQLRQTRSHRGLEHLGCCIFVDLEGKYSSDRDQIAASTNVAKAFRIGC